MASLFKNKGGYYDPLSGTLIKDLSYKEPKINNPLGEIKYNADSASDWWNDTPKQTQPSQQFEPFTGVTPNAVDNSLVTKYANSKNPMDVLNEPLVTPTNIGAPAGSGTSVKQKSPSLAMSQTPSQTTPLETQPTMNGQQMPLSGQPQQPLDIGLNQDSNMYGTDFNNGLAKNSFGGVGDSEPNSLFGSLSKNLFDFSTPEATKNSLGNLATATNVGSSLFDAYSKYKMANAQADYQNRVASLYENKYNDDKARLAKAQANYDASFKA